MKIFGFEIIRSQKEEKDIFKRHDIAHEMTKDLTVTERNRIRQILFKYVPQGMVIWNNDSPESQVRAYMYNAFVYSIVSYIITQIGIVKYKVMKVQGNGKQKELFGHEFLKLLTPFLHEEVFGFKFINGESFAYLIEPDIGLNEGKVIDFQVLQSYLVSVKTGKFGSIDSYIYNGQVSDPLPENKVLHLKYWNPGRTYITEYHGLSPLTPGSKVVTAVDSNFEAKVRSYQNMGPGTIIFNNESGDDYQNFDSEKQAELEKAYRRKYVGTDKAGIPIISPYRLGIAQTGLSPVQLALLEANKVDFVTMCMLYKFPRLLLDFEGSTYANQNDAKKSLYENLIMPEIAGWVAMLNKRCIGGYGENLELQADYNHIPCLQSNKLELWSWLKDAPLTANEKRVELGYEELAEPEMDKVYVPSNLVSLNPVADLVPADPNTNQ